MANIEKRDQQAVERARENETIYAPKVDIWESEDSVILKADMPGVDESSVNVHLEKSILKITGKYIDDYPDGYKTHFCEYRVGNYERSFTLSSDINKEGIVAKVKNGVLDLVLPKLKEVQPKVITVSAG